MKGKEQKLVFFVQLQVVHLVYGSQTYHDSSDLRIKLSKGLLHQLWSRISAYTSYKSVYKKLDVPPCASVKVRM